MPQADMPWVRDGEIMTAAGRRLRLGSPGWFAWLETVSAFCYSSQDAIYWRMTVRREKRRQQQYWYGYARKGRQLHNVYLGKTEALTQARLEEGCRAWTEKARKLREASMREK